MNRTTKLDSRNGWLVRAVTGGTIVFLLFPSVFIIFYSFNSLEYFRWPPAGVSLHWYEKFFTSPRFVEALKNSLVLAATVTPLCTVISLPTALALTRGRFRFRQLLSDLLLSPLIIPGVVTGVAFMTFFSVLGANIGIWKLIIGIAAFALPLAVRAVMANLLSLDINVEEAARNLGATRWKAFFHITLPQLKPGIVAGGIFVFAAAIDDFSISSFLTNERTMTLPVEAFQYIRSFDDPTIAAMSGLLIALACVLVFALDRLVGLEKSIAI